LNPEYVEIARARIEYWSGRSPVVAQNHCQVPEMSKKEG